MNEQFIAAIVGAAVGGLLATMGGLISSLYLRRRSILDTLIQEATRATHGDLGPNFHSKSAAGFRDAIIRARPAINDKAFARCLDMIRHYQNHKPEGFNPESIEYAVFCVHEQTDPRAYAIAFSHKLISEASGSLFEFEYKII